MGADKADLLGESEISSPHCATAYSPPPAKPELVATMGQIGEEEQNLGARGNPLR